MEIDWTEMMLYQHQMRKLTRLMFPEKKGNLTSSEWELLSLLYENPNRNTPILLSKRSGMKKEAVSRCLKSLYKKGYVTRENHHCDERSYCLFLTDTGTEELKKECLAVLTPFYNLLRNIGADFVELLQCADRVVNKMENKSERREA